MDKKNFHDTARAVLMFPCIALYIGFIIYLIYFDKKYGLSFNLSAFNFKLGIACAIASVILLKAIIIYGRKKKKYNFHIIDTIDTADYPVLNFLTYVSVILAWFCFGSGFSMFILLSYRSKIF